jgi:hypothetical protein
MIATSYERTSMCPKGLDFLNFRGFLERAWLSWDIHRTGAEYP